ncbi:hypothetical protein EV401DRAFT_1975678 [Pisolithus croceorrhizus]|nr:hypothetical protein EV401DRAFT_1975678 [Pisolithus croceorrhizus]
MYVCITSCLFFCTMIPVYSTLFFVNIAGWRDQVGSNASFQFLMRAVGAGVMPRGYVVDQGRVQLIASEAVENQRG